MYKNQLQELAQRSCFNLPSYTCIREGPDHAPRFRASVNFNGEIFESPGYCTTLRQAEHSAAEVALNVLSTRGPAKSLTARVLDETGVYKNLLQETAHRAGLKLPVYSTTRSGPGHVPVFTCTVELAGVNFTGEPAKTKKQAEKSAAIAAWSALKEMPKLGLSSQTASHEEAGRKRDQNQARRRMARGHKDGSRSAYSQQKHDCFTPLLPPRPTPSKILPPTSTETRLGENRKNEEDIIMKHPTEKEGPCNSNPGSVYGSSRIPNSFPLFPMSVPDITSRLFGGGPIPSSMVRIPRSIYRIAPAVRIRSVIPVCASPPQPVRVSPPSTKDASPLGATSSSISTQTGTEVFSVSSSFNKLQL